VPYLIVGYENRGAGLIQKPAIPKEEATDDEYRKTIVIVFNGA
jgi:hypothetical protein